MSDTVIRVENISKLYRIGAAQPKYRTLRDHIVDSVGSLFHRNGKMPTKRETIWALKDLSFDVKQGEVLGIIGRNGAGKSTLLKVLSRITKPTTGFAQIRGRVGCLLEVGTGFHLELTGRENVYLNGSILGMTKREINRKFDEIVAFSEVEQFIDTPVKHYSSGMQVRLAFAVAAHLEPEILIIDEVLTVGDQEFQNKCSGKMGEVAQEGRTVLFVSHNMGAVANLCTSAMWLDGGTIQACGEVPSTIRAYIQNTRISNTSDPRQWRRSGSGEARIVEVRLLDLTGNECSSFCMGDTLVIEFVAEFYGELAAVDLSLEIKRLDLGMHVLHLESRDCGFSISRVPSGLRRFRVEIPNCLLYPNSYQISLCIWGPGATYDYVSDILKFSMVQSEVTKRTYPLSRHKEAIFYQPSTWLDLTDSAQ